MKASQIKKIKQNPRYQRTIAIRNRMQAAVIQMASERRKAKAQCPAVYKEEIMCRPSPKEPNCLGAQPHPYKLKPKFALQQQFKDVAAIALTKDDSALLVLHQGYVERVELKSEPYAIRSVAGCLGCGSLSDVKPARSLQRFVAGYLEFGIPRGDLSRVPNTDDFIVWDWQRKSLWLMDDWNGKDYNMVLLSRPGNEPTSMGGLLALSPFKILYSQGGRMFHELDISPELPCHEYADSLLEVVSEQRVRQVGVTQKYMTQTAELSDKKRWTFTGYRKVAYTPDGALEKNLVCTKRLASDGKWQGTRESCCVDKNADAGMSEQDVKHSWVQATAPAAPISLQDRLFVW